MVQEPKPFIANLQPKMFRSNLTYRYIYICTYIYIYIYITNLCRRLKYQQYQSKVYPVYPVHIETPRAEKSWFRRPGKKNSLKNPHPISMLELLSMKNSAKPLSQYISMFFPLLKPLTKSHHQPLSNVILWWINHYGPL